MTSSLASTCLWGCWNVILRPASFSRCSLRVDIRANTSASWSILILCQARSPMASCRPLSLWHRSVPMIWVAAKIWSGSMWRGIITELFKLPTSLSTLSNYWKTLCLTTISSRKSEAVQPCKFPLWTSVWNNVMSYFPPCRTLSKYVVIRRLLSTSKGCIRHRFRVNNRLLLPQRGKKSEVD